MKQSLLWLTPEEKGHIDAKILQNLALEDAVFRCYPREKECKYFLSVLSSPLCQPENIRHRTQILQAFRAHPSLFERLQASLSYFDFLKEQMQLDKSRFRTTARFGTDAKFITSQGLLVTVSIALKRTFESLVEILSILEKPEWENDALSALKERLHAIFEHPSYTELLALLDQLEHMSEHFLVELQFTLNEFGRLKEYDLLSVNEFPETSPEKKGFARFLTRFGKKEEDAKDKTQNERITGIPVTEKMNALRNEVLGSTFDKLTEMMSRMAESLLEEFGGMSHEMVFYQVALNLVKTLEHTGLPLCYSEIKTSGDTQLFGLYDFVLSSFEFDRNRGNLREKIVPNDMNFSAQMPGILIRGENNSGKTVYLRSIACAYLFTQGGLPITAEAGSLTPCANLYTLFASAEKDFSQGNVAGRFEEEVKVFSELVERMQPNSLLFLNEVFQTTAYAEGAKGLYHILLYLAEKGIHWIAVTHLTELFSLFSDSEVSMLETAERDGAQKYRLIPCSPQEKKG